MNYSRGRWKVTTKSEDYIYFFGNKIKNSNLEGGERWQHKMRKVFFWNQNKKRIKVLLREVIIDNKKWVLYFWSQRWRWKMTEVKFSKKSKIHICFVTFHLPHTIIFILVPQNIILVLCCHLSPPSRGQFFEFWLQKNTILTFCCHLSPPSSLLEGFLILFFKKWPPFTSLKSTCIFSNFGFEPWDHASHLLLGPWLYQRRRFDSPA